MTDFVRRAAWLFAAAWFAFVVFTGLRASLHQLRITFQYSRWTTVSAELAHELAEFEAHVPRGNTVLLLYGESGDAAWGVGLWQRSLYGSYNPIRILTSQRDAPGFVKRYRDQTAAHWVLCAGTPMPTVPFEWSLRLNPPNAFPIVLGRLPE